MKTEPYINELEDVRAGVSSETATLQVNEEETNVVVANDKTSENVEHWKEKFLKQCEENTQLRKHAELLREGFESKSQKLRDEIDNWKMKNDELNSQMKQSREEFESKLQTLSEANNHLEKEQVKFGSQIESLQKELFDWKDRFMNKSDETKSKRNVTSSTIKQLRSARPLETKENNIYEVDSLLKHRKKYGQLQYLIHWKNYNSKHDSWQPESDLNCTQLLKQYKRANNLI